MFRKLLNHFKRRRRYTPAEELEIQVRKEIVIAVYEGIYSQGGCPNLDIDEATKFILTGTLEDEKGE